MMPGCRRSRPERLVDWCGSPRTGGELSSPRVPVQTGTSERSGGRVEVVTKCLSDHL